MTRWLLAASGAAIVLIMPSVAGADDVSRADALFNAAKQLRDAGQYADACPQFAQSSRLAPGVGVSLYLADCYEHIGKTASAWAEFRKAEKLAHERNDKRADIAHTRAVALEPKLGGLTIAVPPAAAQQEPEVLLDGAKIPAEEWNATMAVDPGDHVVTVNAAGKPSQSLAAHVDAGNRNARVEVGGGATADASAAAPAAPPAPPPSEPATPGDRGATRRWIGIALLGAGAVGLTIGTAVLLDNNASSAANPPSCTSPPKDNSATVESAIAFAAGGVALAAGLVLTVTNPAKKGVGLTAAPMLSAQGGGALIQGSF